MQVAQIFVWLDKLTDDKLMLSTSLQAQPEKTLFFARDTERLILPDNIQVQYCKSKHGYFEFATVLWHALLGCSSAKASIDA